MANNSCYATNWKVGKFNGDNEVDITDFSRHFLASSALTGGGIYGLVQLIPEPSTLLLLGIGAAFLTYIFGLESLST